LNFLKFAILEGGKENHQTWGMGKNSGGGRKPGRHGGRPAHRGSKKEKKKRPQKNQGMPSRPWGKWTNQEKKKNVGGEAPGRVTSERKPSKVQTKEEAQ